MSSIVSNLKLATLQVFVLLLLCLFSFGAEVPVAWDASPDNDITNYRLKQGAQPGVYTEVQTLGKVLEGKVNNVVPGQNYYVVVTAVNTAGLESLPSNEILIKFPNAPGNLRIVQTPVANGMRLDIYGDRAKQISIHRDNGNGKWKKIETVKNFDGHARFVDKNWKKGKPFEWKVEIDKA